MSIDFHESAPRTETFEGLPLTIKEPTEEHGWEIAFDATDPREIEIYDEAIEGILNIEMMQHHLNGERSTEMHHEWEIDDDSLLTIDKEEVKEKLGEVIGRIHNIASKPGRLRDAA